MQSPCILPSNAPALGSLQTRSEDLDLNSDSSDGAAPRLFSRASNQRAGNGSRATEINLRLRDRKQRRQVKPLPIDQHGNEIPWKIIRDPVLTKSELQSPRYLAYRSKQRNPKGTKNGQVWTDELEEAFQLALRSIPLLGRKKKQSPSYGEKQWGRNELISHFIKERTGIVRTRKQVSSHIQVLKSFLVENGNWMALVTQPDQNQPPNEYGSNDVEKRLSSHLTKTGNRDYSDVRPNPYYNTVPPPPLGILRSSETSHGYHVRRVNFEMYVRDQDLERLHVYTSLQSEIGSASRKLENVPDWQLMYPRLASYCDRGQLDGEIILFETNFNLMGKHPPSKSNLTIDFTIDIGRGIDFSKWECHSDFYEQGLLQKSLSTPLDAESLASTGDARIVVLLHSKWWVDHFIELTKQKLEIEKGDIDAVQQMEERIRRQIRDISVVQEIWATHQFGGSTSERIAILIWSFRQARNHEVATTTWRKLIPPADKTELYDPTPDSTLSHHQPSFAIDTALQQHSLQQHTPLYAEHFKPEPFFAENSETLFVDSGTRLSPSSSTPVHEHNSLPSSTSASFPSSTSSSTLPPELYQGLELDFDSQDSIFASKEVKYSSDHNHRYSSQDATHHNQVTTVIETQESDSFPSQDYYYVSQATACEAQGTDGPYFVPTHPKYQSHQDNYHILANRKEINAGNSTQDLRMHSQLSFSGHNESPPAYNAPFIAPLINMMETEQFNYDELQHQPSNFHIQCQKSPIQSHHSQPLHHDCFDLEEWQMIDHNVQWVSHKTFQSSGDLEEVGDVMKQHGHVLGEIGEIGELETGNDVDLAFQ